MKNNWIEWNGGEMPVKEGAIIDVKYRDGEIKYAVVAGERYAIDWNIDDVDADIVAYRPSFKLQPHRDHLIEIADAEVLRHLQAGQQLDAEEVVRITVDAVIQAMGVTND